MKIKQPLLEVVFVSGSKNSIRWYPTRNLAYTSVHLRDTPLGGLQIIIQIQFNYVMNVCLCRTMDKPVKSGQS